MWRRIYTQHYLRRPLRRQTPLVGSEGRSFLGSALDGARSPSSKRSSGFWGQDVGWDCCHEISAESGEGVEEVFRVVTRKLVEQNRKAMEAGSSLNPTPGPTPGLETPDGYFDANPRGSFRVGRDRRSWLGFPPGVVIEEAAETDQTGQGTKSRKRCC